MVISGFWVKKVFSQEECTYDSAIYKGELESSIFDTQNYSSSPTGIRWAGFKPENTFVGFKLAVSNVNDFFVYKGENNSENSYFKVAPGVRLDISSFDRGRYLRYKVFLASCSGLSPTIERIYIYYSP